MYRLLIVDDEEIITDGLYEVFNQLMPEEMDICRAYSGKEALNWMSRTRIDIVLTDIRMPGMSGLELTEEIQTYWPRCRIIFLTGYSEFDYAYKAIQMSNVRYLLKTEGYAKVTQTVQEVMQELNHGIQLNELLEQSREQKDTLEFMAQGDYFRHFLQESHGFYGNQEALVQDFDKLNISVDPKAPVVLALGRLSYAAAASYTERSQILASSRIIWNSFMKDQTRSIGIVDKYGDIVWFIQTSMHSEEKFNNHFMRYLEGTLELIQEACLASLGLTIGFTISGASCEWGNVTPQYERLRQLQQLKIGDGISMILMDRSDQFNSSSIKEGFVPSHKAEVMEAHLEAGRAAEFFDDLEEMSRSMLQASGKVQRTIEGYYSIALVLLSYINRMGLHSQIEDNGKLMRLDDHASMKEGFLYLKQIADEIFKFKHKDERDRASHVIERICQFIEEHLSEDLSLVRLAEIHYFNPSYLSRFFKQERGINLSEYIDKCRLRKAKDLLRDGDLKVREVASFVGYEAAHSFTRFFKKATALTPQEYRDSLSVIE
ncbi:response regulator transcription factor [Paenibacillus sp. LPE1-1-1.1]|uniref:response regulator transcription factor n=1 Tax=Paenibacillus sp. LPE1-1-1.1 TaxID=3135230 RepID=UPI003418849E